MFWLYLVVIAAVSYLLGGLNGALITSKLIFRKDIREYGSGNAGLTNFYRIFGTKGVVLVLLVDVLKTVLAAGLGWFLLGQYGCAHLGRLYAGLFVMIGHVFPAYYGFKGGKGVLTLGVVALSADIETGLIAWGVFLLVVLLSGYVSLGSICGSFALVIATILIIRSPAEVVLTILCCGVVVFMHRSNIRRILNGEEKKFHFKK